MAYPYQLDPGDLLAWGNDGPPGGVLGAFTWQNDRYVLAWDDSGGSIGMWKSADRGITWTELDSANRPTCSATGGFWRYSYKLIDHETHVLYVNGSEDLAIKSFELYTGQWGIDRPGGPTPSGFGGNEEILFALDLEHRVGADQFVAFYHNFGTKSEIWGVVCSGSGIWGTPFQITGGSASTLGEFMYPGPALLPNDDIIILSYRQRDSDGFKEVGYHVLEPDDTLAGFVELFAIEEEFYADFNVDGDSPWTPDDFQGILTTFDFSGVLPGAEIVFLLSLLAGSGNWRSIVYAVRIPYASSPANWSRELIDQDDDPGSWVARKWPLVPVRDGIGALHAVWGQEDGTPAHAFGGAQEWYYSSYLTSPAGWSVRILIVSRLTYSPVVWEFGTTVAAGPLYYGFGIFMGRYPEAYFGDMPLNYWEVDTTGLGPDNIGDGAGGGNFCGGG